MKTGLKRSNSSIEKNPWAYSHRRHWKRYPYGIVGAEISTTTRFSDCCFQINPLQHDTGLLFEAIQCPDKQRIDDFNKLSTNHLNKNKRDTYIINGNLNYDNDIQKMLTDLHRKLSRHSRLFIIVYNPFFSFLYHLASTFKLRHAPKPNVFLTEKNIRSFATLSNYEVVRVRPSVFVPFYVPLISNFINKTFPVLPLIRRMSFLWVMVLRPINPEQENPSLSIIIPARNEEGNIESAIKRIPQFPSTEIEVIFVEGNSTDDTWQRIQDEMNKPIQRFKLSAFKQPGRGKNDAVRVGFENAKGDLVTILDADLTMPPEMLIRFYDAYCRGLGDFINGSRLVYPLEDKAMKPLNRLGNIFFSKMLSWILTLPISDSLCGTKLFCLQDYKRLIAWRKHFGDFDPFGDFEMLFAASELALGVIDIPVQYKARIYGETNIHRFRDGFELARMTAIGFFRITVGKTK